MYVYRTLFFAVLVVLAYLFTAETENLFYVSKSLYYTPRVALFVAVVLFFNSLVAIKEKKEDGDKKKKLKAVPSADETDAPAEVSISRERIAPSLGFAPSVSAASTKAVDIAEIKSTYEEFLTSTADDVSAAASAAQATEQSMASPKLVAAFEAFEASLTESAPAEAPRAEKPKAAKQKFGRTVLVGTKGRFALSFDRRTEQNYLAPLGEDGSTSRDRIYLAVDAKNRKAVMAAATAVIN